MEKILSLTPFQLGLAVFAFLEIYGFLDGGWETLEPTALSATLHFAPEALLSFLFVGMISLFHRLLANTHSKRV